MLAFVPRDTPGQIVQVLVDSLDLTGTHPCHPRSADAARIIRLS